MIELKSRNRKYLNYLDLKIVIAKNVKVNKSRLAGFGIVL